MTTLADLLVRLRQLGVLPREVEIPRRIFLYIMQIAERLAYENVDEEDEEVDFADNLDTE